jgi:hypothetical protein
MASSGADNLAFLLDGVLCVPFKVDVSVQVDSLTGFPCLNRSLGLNSLHKLLNKFGARSTTHNKN